MKDESLQKPKWMFFLFFVYLFFLVWIILFKMQFYFSNLPYIRSINLLPFQESVIVNGAIDFSEIINNFLIFIPFGFFLEFLWKEKSWIKKFFLLFLMSFSLEIFQYLFHVGASDITDILMNSLGGLFGLWFTKFLYFIFKDSDKVTFFLKFFVIL